MIKFLTLRQFICPLSLFLKEIPFASLTNAIDMKIERVLTGFLIGWSRLFSQSKSPLELFYLIFDWWKHFLKILRCSEVTTNLTRRLKKNGGKWVRPLEVLYSFLLLFFSDAPSPCGPHMQQYVIIGGRWHTVYQKKKTTVPNLIYA